MKQLLEAIKKDYPLVYDKMRVYTYGVTTTDRCTYHDLECFFDDNEIYIEISFGVGPDFAFSVIDSKLNKCWFDCDDICKTRTEAKHKAILKASEILEERLNVENNTTNG